MRTKLSIFCDKVIEAGWLAAVVIVPLFFNIHSNRVFEPDKLSLLRSIALVMAAAWLIRAIEDWRISRANGSSDQGGQSLWTKIYKTPLVLATLLLVLVYLISTVLSVTWQVSLMGSYQRLQGTYTTLSYIVIFFMILQGMRTKRQFNRLITTMVLVSFPIAMYGLVQHFGLDPLPWGGNVTTRVASNMGNAIFVSAFLIMVVPLTLSRLLENWREAAGSLGALDVLLGGLAFVLLAVTLLVGMSWDVALGKWWIRIAALLVGVGLQVPIYLLSPAERRPKVLAISLPLTFAFLVAFTWIMELFRPGVAPSDFALNPFWLGLAAALIFIIAMVFFAYYLRVPVARLILLAAYFIILIAQLICIFYTQSRGPFLGLLASVALFFGILGLIKRQVWLSWLVTGLAMVGLIGLVLFNAVAVPLIDTLREVPYVGRLGKVLQTEEGTGKVRVLIWEGAVELIGWHEPLEWPGEEGKSDSFNAVRPIIGYGPESMYVAYNRYYPPELAHFEKRNASPDRSHNETFDALVTTGWLGLAAYLLLFSSVFYFGLKWLGLMPKSWQRWAFAALWIGGGILGMVGTWVWRGPAYIGVGIPMGAMLGLAVYVFISLLLATIHPGRWQPAEGKYQLWILALLAAMIAHFVEIQFGIAIAATRTYFWAMAATMVVIGIRLAQRPAEAEEVAAEGEAATEGAQATPRRRRRRAGAQAVESRRRRTRSQDWTGSLLVLSILAILILGTMLFNWITPQQDTPGLVATIWKSLTRRQGDLSLVLLAVFLFTWLMVGLVGLSDLSTRKESADTPPRDWTAGIGIFILVSFGGAFLYALFHTKNLKPATITAEGISSPVVQTITFYYIFAFLTLLVLATVLAFLFRRKSIPWRWSGDLGWLGIVLVIAVGAVLPLLILATWVLIGYLGDVGFIAAGAVLPLLILAAVLLLILAAVLAFLFRRKSIPWRWSGYLGDVGVIAAELVLPLLVVVVIFATNISIIRADIWYKQGLSSERMGQWDAAIPLYEEATGTAPGEDFYYLFLGRSFMEKGNTVGGADRELWLQESKNALLQARDLAPLNTDHSRNLAKLYLSWANLSQGEQRTELFDKALAFSDDALSLSPNTADVLNERAQIYAAMGDYDQAQETYQESLAVDDEYAQTYLAMGKLYTVQEEFEEAIAAYQRVTEIRPKSAESYSNLGYIYSKRGDNGPALEAYEKAIQFRPRNYLDRQNLAILYYQMGRVDDAVREATRALELAPANQKQAIESFLAQLGQPVGEASPESSREVQELLSQGRAQMEAEDWPAAERSYLQALELNPNNPLIHSALAYIFARQGRLDEAITENLAVLDLIPGDYNSYKNLAILYQQKGDIAQAIAATEEALSVAPEEDLPALQSFLEQLRAVEGSTPAQAEPGQRAGDLAPGQRNQMYRTPPPMVIDPVKSYQATIVSEFGNIILKLHADRAPNTVNNFVFLAREGYYDSTTFHRVLPDFMAQGGDPTGTGAGGPGYTFADEFDPSLLHDGPGVLSMANSGPNTNGSQFFITYDATPWLDGRHAVFGRVVEGMEVLHSLMARDPQQNPDYEGDKILTIVIEEE